MIKPAGTTMAIFCTCPYCEAAPMQPCTWGDYTYHGAPIMSIHGQRYELGDRAARYPQYHPFPNALFRMAAGIVEIALAHDEWEQRKEQAKVESPALNLHLNLSQS